MSFKAYVFDAYGTLFDVHSAVSRHFDKVGENPIRVSEVWRNKQLEYTWTRSGMSQYKDFWSLTSQALDFALASVPGSNADCREALLDAYMSLDCYNEVPAKTAILSNGSPNMLNAAVESAGLDAVLDDAFSIHELGVFKTAPQTYGMVTEAYGIEPSQVAFQSSNRWDIAGATAFGFHCNWINRTSQPDEYLDLGPKSIISDLNGLL